MIVNPQVVLSISFLFSKKTNKKEINGRGSEMSDELECDGFVTQSGRGSSAPSLPPSPLPPSSTHWREAIAPVAAWDLSAASVIHSHRCSILRGRWLCSSVQNIAGKMIDVAANNLRARERCHWCVRNVNWWASLQLSLPLRPVARVQRVKTQLCAHL